MVIPISGTFQYEAEFTEEGFGETEILLRGTDLDGRNEDRLVGLNPKIRFWHDRLVLIASGDHKSSMRNVSLPIGDAVTLAARPNDRLYLTRTGAGGVGLSVLRQGALVLALGAVASVPLGSGLQVTCCPEGTDIKHPPADTWLGFSVGSERVALRGKEVAEICGCHIYVERSWAPGIPGTDECVAVCVGEHPTMRIAAIRSAVLLGNGALKMTRWDCTEHFCDL